MRFTDLLQLSSWISFATKTQLRKTRRKSRSAHPVAVEQFESREVLSPQIFLPPVTPPNTVPTVSVSESLTWSLGPSDPDPTVAAFTASDVMGISVSGDINNQFYCNSDGSGNYSLKLLKSNPLNYSEGLPAPQQILLTLTGYGATDMSEMTTASLVIQVEDAGVAPDFMDVSGTPTSSYAFSVSEGATTLGAIQITDVDGDFGNYGMSYTAIADTDPIDGFDAAALFLMSNSAPGSFDLVLSSGTVLDYESLPPNPSDPTGSRAIRFDITATDADGNSATANVVIAVTNAGVAPTFQDTLVGTSITDYSVPVPENSTTIGDLRIVDTDGDFGDFSPGWASIIDDDLTDNFDPQSFFSLSPIGDGLGTASIVLNPNATLDYESIPADPLNPTGPRQITFRVCATDLDGNSSVLPVSVNVINVLEAPSFQDPPNNPEEGWHFDVSEMAEVGDFVGSIPVSDPQGDNLSFTVFKAVLDASGNLPANPTWAPANEFQVMQSGQDADISVAEAVLDYELTREFILKIIASDVEMNSSEIIITVHVLNELEWGSTGIFVADRDVWAGYRHTAIVIIPEDQSAWEANPAFTQNVYVNRELKKYTILSAEKGQSPTIAEPDNFGNLTKYATPGESIELFTVTGGSLGTVGTGGIAENDLIASFLTIHSTYDNDTPYVLHPDSIGEANSNSYCHGLLIAAQNMHSCITFPDNFSSYVNAMVDGNPIQRLVHSGWDFPLLGSLFD